ncbi:MAG: archease [Candidatus Methanoperedens sp.]|nr:archease [Candidatus Methanoperedens sp.]
MLLEPVAEEEKKYEYLYHIADAKFRAYGDTLEKAFGNAALAMFNVMTDTANLKHEMIKQVELTSHDIERLLVDWLSELLYLFEVEGIIFGKFEVGSIKKDEDGFSLKANAWGENIDLSTHHFDTQVKAVTYHELEVKKNDVYCVQVVLDT